MKAPKQGVPNVATFLTVDVGSKENDIASNAAGRGAVMLGRMISAAVEGGEGGQGAANMRALIASMDEADLLAAAFDLTQLAIQAEKAEQVLKNVAMAMLVGKMRDGGIGAVAKSLDSAMEKTGMNEGDRKELLGALTEGFEE